jgi:hypothetical protein
MQEIIKASLINYVKNIKLRDNVFILNNIISFVSFINSGFFVDYVKSLKALI